MSLKKVLRGVGVVVVVIAGLLVLVLVAALLTYGPVYVYRVLAWRESDAFDWQKFPAQPLHPAPVTHHFPTAPDPRVADLFAKLSGAANWERYLAENQTQAFIVIRDGEVLYEQYLNNTRRDSLVTSFSVAKSFVSALIGCAIAEGFIHSIDDPITTYLPELAARDPRFAEITIRYLLLMASGLAYEEFRFLLFNSDDPLTTYYPNQRRLALENTQIASAPMRSFRYNKYHPQLLGMILERTTGMRVTDYLQTRLWDPLGMEFGGSWSTDSEASDFEKMETGINARAIDFAKLGVLFLEDGQWLGRQVLPQDWVAASTQPFFPDIPGYYPGSFSTSPAQRYYALMWWGLVREGDGYDFAAIGDKGQYIYVSPHKKLVIARNGIDYGAPSWLELFYQFATAF